MNRCETKIEGRKIKNLEAIYGQLCLGQVVDLIQFGKFRGGNEREGEGRGEREREKVLERIESQIRFMVRFPPLRSLDFCF